MSTHQRMFLIVSLFVLLRSVLSYYQDSSAENDSSSGSEEVAGDELKNDLIVENLWKGNSDSGPINTDTDDARPAYPENNIKEIFLKNDPQLFFVASMYRKRNNKVARLPTNKKNLMNNSIKDDMQKVPGKPSLSIISPLEALQRKVAVVYNSRQKERNRGLLNNYGKRSSASNYPYMDSYFERNEPVLQSDNDKLKQYERRLYGLYRVPGS